MIVRGTTKQIHFSFPGVDLTDIAVAYLTVKQGNVIIEYDLSDATSVTSDEIAWTLTQEDTLAFAAGKKPARVQCRYRLSDGTAGASKITEEDIYGILKSGEI